MLAARVLGTFASEQGLDVKVSEIHGMSQRGGSVVTHVRFGQMVPSPVIEAGTADVVMAFELLEAARYVGMLRVGGSLLVNTQQILPLPVLTGSTAYPSDLVTKFASLPITTVALDCLAEAQAIGNIKTVNTLLLGAFAKRTETDVTQWKRAITANVKEAHLTANLVAFDRGYALAARASSTSPTGTRGRG